MALRTLGSRDQRASQPATPPGAEQPRTPNSPTAAESRRPPLAVPALSAHLRPRLAASLPALVLGVVLALLWQALTATGSISPFLLPPPIRVAQRFAQGLGTVTPAQVAIGPLHITLWAYSPGTLVVYASTTVAESILGFALGALVALPLGYALARSRLLARALQPYLAASQAMPAVALAPLLVLWLGFGLVPVVVLCALIVFFPMVITTALGLRLLDHEILDAAQVDGAGRWALLCYLELPLALPSILAGMRTSLTLSITGAVVGEFVIGDQGLGGLLSIARAQFDSPLVFATLLMLALLAALAYRVPRPFERWFSYLEAK